MRRTRPWHSPGLVLAAATPLALVALWWLRSHGAAADGALASAAASLGHLGSDIGSALGALADSSWRAQQTGNPGAVTGATGAAAAGAGGTTLGEDPFSRGVKGSLKEKLPDFVYDSLFGDEPEKEQRH